MQASIIFPVHNEEGSLDELITRANEALEAYFGIENIQNQSAFEFVFIDDASTDGSFKILKSASEQHPHIRVLHHDSSRGQTGAFKSGFDVARGEVAVTMDADLEVLPEDIPLLLRKMDEGYEIVNAIRRERKHAWVTKLQSRIYNMLMWLFFQSPFHDNASNFTAVRSSLIKNLPLTDNDHRYLFPILRTRGLTKWAEVEVRHELRKSGVSKYSRFKSVKSAFEMIPAWLRIRSGRYKLNI